MLTGNVAIVTGAARGIGRATAARLARDGSRVALVDRDEAGLAAAVEAIRAEGGMAEPHLCDVTDVAQVERTVQAVAERWGGIYALVNNAGVIRDNLLFRMTDEDWDTVIAVHLKGAFLMTRAAQRHMVTARSGRIICTSSTSAFGNRAQANYAAAKAGLVGFVRTLAIELGPFGITANAVAPGYIDTEMTRSSARRQGLEPEQAMADAAAHIPLRRVGMPADVAGVVRFLVSADASYVSGQLIVVAGGPV